MNRAGKLCASCDRWDLSGASEADRARGAADCLGYEKPGQPWGEPFCVLYNPARDLNARRALVKQFFTTQQQAATTNEVTP